MASLIEAAKRKGLIQGDVAPSTGRRSLVEAARGRQPSSTAAREVGTIEKLDTATARVFEPVSNFLFGTAGKMIGGLGGAAVEQVQGKEGVFTKGLEKELATPGKAAKNIGLTALELFPGGGVLERAGAKLGSKIAPGLKAAAESQYLRALAPTTKEMKAKATKIVPKLLERGVTAFTRKGLGEKAQRGLEVSGEALETVLETIPGKTPVGSGPILKALKDAKNAFLVPGTKVVADPKAVQAINQVEAVVRKLGKNVSFESLRGLRQIWDKSVAKSKGFLMDEVGSFSVMAKREGSNAIRKELAKKFPDLAKVNAEYSFWKNVDDVVSATIQRTAGQAKPLGERAATLVGGAVGLAKSGIKSAATTALAFRTLARVLNSTAWNTMSAVQKNKIADALMSGSFTEIFNLASKLVSPAVRSQEPEETYR